MKRKIVQVQVVFGALYALADDGTLWMCSGVRDWIERKQQAWRRVADLPTTEQQP